MNKTPELIYIKKFYNHGMKNCLTELKNYQLGIWVPASKAYYVPTGFGNLGDAPLTIYPNAIVEFTNVKKIKSTKASKVKKINNAEFKDIKLGDFLKISYTSGKALFSIEGFARFYRMSSTGVLKWWETDQGTILIKNEDFVNKQLVLNIRRFQYKKGD